MDSLDTEILRRLQQDNRTPAAEIGQAVGLSVSAAAERVRRLNAAGIVQANRAVLDPAAVGLSLLAFIFVDLVPQADEPDFVAAMQAMVEGRSRVLLCLGGNFSIAEAIIVSAAGQTCAVPQAFVEAVLQVPEAEVRTITEAEVIPYRDGVLPLVRLRSLFGGEAAPRPQLAVLVLGSERGTTGLVVDRVHTQREVVVRAMPDPLLQVPGIAGATELGDGRPVLILDVVALTQGVVRPRDSETLPVPA